MEIAGLAVATVVTASTGETAGVAGAGPALFSAGVAASGGTDATGIEVASAGAGEVGPGSVLVALCGRHGLSYLGCPKFPTPQR